MNLNNNLDGKRITAHLARIRANYANKRNKKHTLHLLTTNPQYNYHQNINSIWSEYDQEVLRALSGLLPSRRAWIRNGNTSRYSNNSYGVPQRTSSQSDNILSILKTIEKSRNVAQPPVYHDNLAAFISNIQEKVASCTYSFEPPITIPSRKKPKSINQNNVTAVCRPISLYSLPDRIVLTAVNKYLTQLIDPIFSDCSYAFRSSRLIYGKYHPVTHHDAVARILEYKKRFHHTDLWVAECDMKKFYDSVSHDVIIKRFYYLINKVKNSADQSDLTSAIHLFMSYLDSYSFPQEVYSYNGDSDYWRNHNIPNGAFHWVEKELIEKHHHPNPKKSRIGVPQGGALSGLIANIVLDYADGCIPSDPDVLYLRYCDDMIIMHPDRSSCAQAMNLYKAALDRLSLVSHDSATTNSIITKYGVRTNPLASPKAFWEFKTKGPYFWADHNKGGFKWIGFVGYEIDYQLNIRVRNKSLIKEITKQKQVIDQIRLASKKAPRKHQSTFCESATHRLIGMSVGRVELWNYQVIDNSMCWINGFKLLYDNPFLRRQLRILDRSRNKLLRDLERSLQGLTPTIPIVQTGAPVQRQIPKYHKPFSYFYHALKGPPLGPLPNISATNGKAPYSIHAKRIQMLRFSLYHIHLIRIKINLRWVRFYYLTFMAEFDKL